MWDQKPIEEKNKFIEAANEELRIYNQQIESLHIRADDLVMMGMSYNQKKTRKNIQIFCQQQKRKAKIRKQEQAIIVPAFIADMMREPNKISQIQVDQPPGTQHCDYVNPDACSGGSNINLRAFQLVC